MFETLNNRPIIIIILVLASTTIAKSTLLLYHARITTIATAKNVSEVYVNLSRAVFINYMHILPCINIIIYYRRALGSPLIDSYAPIMDFSGAVSRDDVHRTAREYYT